MSFFKAALKFVGEALAESNYSRNSVTRPVRFGEVSYVDIKGEVEGKIATLDFVIKSEAGGNWTPVGLVRKVSQTHIHFSPTRDGRGVPDLVEITRNHTGKLVARAKYDNSVHVTVR
jgi:hypothetical protein